MCDLTGTSAAFFSVDYIRVAASSPRKKREIHVSLFVGKRKPRPSIRLVVVLSPPHVRLSQNHLLLVFSVSSRRKQNLRTLSSQCVIVLVVAVYWWCTAGQCASNAIEGHEGLIESNWIRYANILKLSCQYFALATGLDLGCAAIVVLAFSVCGPGWLAKNITLSPPLAFMICLRHVHPSASASGMCTLSRCDYITNHFDHTAGDIKYR
ncbi:hypothetical protein SSX86_001636 [Deinandra increscens subsp. villosa]|uniref:Uncharacterized protein n=1 Tax=Deinandra increscens subsp. villosa TaxID=3103831 RepID=A0AAP0DRR5_9ASTR